MSHVIEETAGVLGITLKHATKARSNNWAARTISRVNRTGIETGEWKSQWHKHVSSAVPKYNTSYQESIGCEPSRFFHGSIPYNVLDLKMGIRPQKIPTPDSQNTQDVLEQTEMFFQDVLKKVMEACM